MCFNLCTCRLHKCRLILTVALNHAVPQSRQLYAKKVAKPYEWKRNRKKASREHGERYVSVSGKTVLARAIRVANHSAACRMGCEGNITARQRQEIHDDFWKLCESEKRHYFARTTQRECKKDTALIEEVGQIKLDIVHIHISTTLSFTRHEYRCASPIH